MKILSVTIWKKKNIILIAIRRPGNTEIKVFVNCC